MSTPTPFRLGRRGIIIGAAALGFAVGGYTLASAAQSAFTDDNPSQSDLLEVGADVTVDASVEVSVDDSTSDTTPDSVEDTIDDNGGDDGSSTTIDDSDDSDDDSTSTTAGSSNPLPAPFTETYLTAGGSITVTWDGAKFHLDAAVSLDGSAPEIEQRWDRIKVRFRGSNDSRIEVRISDDDNSVRVDID